MPHLELETIALFLCTRIAPPLPASPIVPLQHLVSTLTEPPRALKCGASSWISGLYAPAVLPRKNLISKR